jgi:glycosyltransferase involved in cell wall biosynthesis
MKLLLISPSFYPAIHYGGPIYSTYELAKSLKKTGVDVRVITTNANGNEKLKIKTGTFHKLENELPVKYYKSLDSRGTSLSMILNLKKEIKEADIVYLISIFSPPTPFVIRLCRKMNKPLIISPRGQLGKWCLEQGNRIKKIWLDTFIKQHLDILNWHTTAKIEENEVKIIYPTAKTFIVPNGIDTLLFSDKNIKKDKTFYNTYSSIDCTTKNIIISMSRIHRKKGFDILIEAFNILLKENPDCLLFIAGEDFGERNYLLNIISLKNLSAKVFLIGPIEGEEKLNFLKNADVFALPSHNENFGIVYGEALAAGTPVIASTNTPWQDVEKFNCGKCVDNTPDKFAKAINEILNSDIVQMGKNGSIYIEDNFSWRKIGRNFKMKIDQILSEKV